MNPNPWFDQNPKFRRLYLNNAWFKAACDSLIPVLLEGLAANAEEKEREQARLLHMARQIGGFDPEACEGFLERLNERTSEEES